jgi:hypothetical protein
MATLQHEDKATLWMEIAVVRPVGRRCTCSVWLAAPSSTVAGTTRVHARLLEMQAVSLQMGPLGKRLD